MKKILFCMLMTIVVGMMASCNGCSKSEKPQEKAVAQVYHDYDGVVQDFTAGVAQIQALHKQTMFALNGGEYEWRNSKVMLNDTITTENIDQLHITCVTDVFQLWIEGPVVQFISTDVEKGTILPWPIHDVWIEDASLNDMEIKVTAEEALLRLKEWNGILPKACSLSLRNPVGPKACNAQWVIGDVFTPLFIDAVTGEIRDSNPAF